MALKAEQSNGNGNGTGNGNATNGSTRSGDTQDHQQQQQQQDQQQQTSIRSPETASATATAAAPAPPGMARLAVCASGIGCCYLYYGILQERLFMSGGAGGGGGGNNEEEEEEGQRQRGLRLGATFVLVTQCVTNTLVAYMWQQIQRKWWLPPPATPPGAGAGAGAGGPKPGPGEESDASSSSSSSSILHHHYQNLPLHHALLLFTSACYCAAMTCSNEAIQYVSYPVAVLAKSCKLIPTMLVGQIVERGGKLYSAREWLAALAISAGIVLFHWSRQMEQQEQQQQQHKSSNTEIEDDDGDDSGRATYGMMLLLVSLVMDGVLSSCQNFLKRPPASTAMSATVETDPVTGGTLLTLTPGRTAYRPPTAVETMLYVNLYSLFFLIPACVYTGQWQHGVDALLDSSSSGGGLDNVHQQQHEQSLVQKILVLNAAAAAGQVFIFLTITWYTPVITTTITTTRKFVTILLSVWAFGHSFSPTQWTAVALVFTGLYLVIAEQQRQQRQKSESESAARSTSTSTTKAKME